MEMLLTDINPSVCLQLPYFLDQNFNLNSTRKKKNQVSGLFKKPDLYVDTYKLYLVAEH